MTIFAWLIVVIAFLTAAVCGELATRWWIRYRRRYYVLPPGLRLRLQPDPEVLPQLERQIRFDVNSEGERGDEVPRSRQGLFRILVAGGSQPEGYLLDQETAWPGALQRVLQTPAALAKLNASRVHVGNIARSGVGSQALDLILERVLPRYPRLQAIIILVGASDVLQWLEVGAPPAAAPAPRVSDVFRCHPELKFGWKPGRLALVEHLLQMRHRWLRPMQVHPRACRWIGRAREMRARAREIRFEVADPAPMLTHFDACFRSALKRAKAHADRVIVVRQPWFSKHCSPEESALMWHGGVGQVWREDVTAFYSFEVLSELMAAVDGRAARIAHEQRVEQVDLMPVLAPSTANYYDFFHATPAGARVITSAVALAVLRESRLSVRLYDDACDELEEKVS